MINDITCPYCGTANITNSSACTGCGAGLPRGTLIAEPAPTININTTLRPESESYDLACWKCRMLISTQALVCPFCNADTERGAELIIQRYQEEVAAAKKRAEIEAAQKRANEMGCLYAFFGVIGFILFMWAVSSISSNTASTFSPTSSRYEISAAPHKTDPYVDDVFVRQSSLPPTNSLQKQQAEPKEEPEAIDVQAETSAQEQATDNTPNRKVPEENYDQWLLRQGKPIPASQERPVPGQWFTSVVIKDGSVILTGADGWKCLLEDSPIVWDKETRETALTNGWWSNKDAVKCKLKYRQ